MDTEKVSPLVLPESQLHLLRKTDMLPTRHNDGRRFPRRHWVKRTRLRCVPPFSLPGRTSVMREILVIDLSRGGIRFFSGDMLFPTEYVSVELAPDSWHTMQIAWCSEVEGVCFQAGARFARVPEAANACAAEKLA